VGEEGVSDVSPNRQRIAIAEVCGWRYVPERDVSYHTPAGKVVPGPWIDPQGEPGQLPDYLHDLNAMDVALHTLKKAERRLFVSILWELQNGSPEPGDDVDQVIWGCTTASAAQRAEAFLLAHHRQMGGLGGGTGER